MRLKRISKYSKMAEVKEKKIVIFTKYEIARIIGARALQISMNAPILLALKKEELEKMNFDSLKIAEAEFKAGILPITVKRPFPQLKELEDGEEVIEEPVEEKKEETPAAAELAVETAGETQETEEKPAEE